MSINQGFAIFCAKRCLHLWDAPEKVKEWLDNPKKETAREAAWETRKAEQAAGTAGTAGAAAWAARSARSSIWAAAGEIWAGAWAVKTATRALGTTEKELKLEFVSIWTEEQLRTTDQEWVEYATVEIMNREY